MKRSRVHMPALIGALAALIALGAIGLLFRTPVGVAQEQQPMLEYPSFPPTPTIGPNPTAAAGVVSGVPIASESFSDPANFAAWSVVDLEFVLAESRSLWQVADGRLEQNYTAAAGNPSTLETTALHPTTWADGSIQTSFYDLTNGVAGLIVRYNGDDGPTASYYRYRIIKNSYSATPKQVLEKVVDGVAVSLVEIPTPGFDERTWNVLEFSAIGGQLTVTLNGKVVAQATDPQPLAAGRSGVYSRALGGLFFDDVVISTP